MSFYQDQQIRGYCLFLILFSLLVLGAGLLFSSNQVKTVKIMYHTHDEAVASSLLAQGVPKEVIAVALTNTEVNEHGKELYAAIGIGAQTTSGILPFISQFQWETIWSVTIIAGLIMLTLFFGTLFSLRRENGYIYERKKQLITT